MIKKKLLLILCLLSVGLASVEAGRYSGRRRRYTPPTGKLETSGLNVQIQKLKEMLKDFKREKKSAKTKAERRRLSEVMKGLKKKIKETTKALKKARENK